MLQFWITYRIPGVKVESAVPVSINDDGEACLCDGAYDAFDHFYNPADYDDDGGVSKGVVTGYQDFESAVCLAALQLADAAEFDSVGLNVRGEHFVFGKAYLDNNGN